MLAISVGSLDKKNLEMYIQGPGDNQKAQTFISPGYRLYVSPEEANL